jgi:hypothetical protein
MKTTCPACGSAFDLDAAVSDADARRFADLVAGLDPRVAKPLIGYLALFRPPKIGMRWSRMLTLAQEIEPMIREARVRRNGIVYPCPNESWAAALGYLADRPKAVLLPLKSHGYLLEMLASQAEKQAARDESAVEAQRRVGRTGAHSEPAPLAEAFAPKRDYVVVDTSVRERIGAHVENLKDKLRGKA